LSSDVAQAFVCSDPAGCSWRFPRRYIASRIEA
jgi:hypothetical protein